MQPYYVKNLVHVNLPLIFKSISEGKLCVYPLNRSEMIHQKVEVKITYYNRTLDSHYLS